MIITLKLEAKLTVRADLRGFWSQIDFQQTAAVCAIAGQQAAGAWCQDVCLCLKLVWPFSSVTQRSALIFGSIQLLLPVMDKSEYMYSKQNYQKMTILSFEK